jgi:hypothetical protein
MPILGESFCNASSRIARASIQHLIRPLRDEGESTAPENRLRLVVRRTASA